MLDIIIVLLGVDFCNVLLCGVFFILRELIFVDRGQPEKYVKKFSCYMVCARVFVVVVWLFVCLLFFCKKEKARTQATSKKVRIYKVNG